MITMKTISNLLLQSVGLKASFVRSLWALCSLLIVFMFSSGILTSILTTHKKCLNSLDEAVSTKINLTVTLDTWADHLLRWEPDVAHISDMVTRIPDHQYVRFYFCFKYI